MHWQRLKRFILKIRNVDRCTDFVCVCSKNSVGHMRNCIIQKKKDKYKILSSFFLCCNGIQELFSKNSLCMCSFTLRKVTNAFNQDGQLCAGRGDTVQD